MISINDFLEKVKEFEGWRNEPYLCPSGVLTIGYGHTHGVTQGMHITYDYGQLFLQYDLGLAFSQLQSCHQCKFLVGSPLSFALTDFIFNIGITKYKNSTLKKVVDSIKDVNQLTDSERQRVSLQLQMWCYSKSKKLKGLEKRRAWEVSLLYED